MSIFEDINNTTEKASNIGERYVKTSHRYFKLKLFQQLTLSLSMVAKTIVIGSLLFVGLVFLSVALALKLSDVFESAILGYLSVGGIFLVIAIMLFVLRSRITKLILRKMSLKFFN